jgi:acetolactate synthase-1/3 small subunit
MNTHVLSVLVENRAGTLSRVSGLFSRRGFNIDSLTVGRTDNPDVSRMTVVVLGADDVLEQIRKQLGKLIDVIAIEELDPSKSVKREIMLVKVKANEQNRPAIIGLASVFRGRVVDISATSITIEATGGFGKLDGLLELLRPYGILEMARTGAVALARGNEALREPAV